MTTRSLRQVVRTLAVTVILLTGLSCQPTFDWAIKAGGSTGFDFGSDVATDAVGNAYVTGEFRGTVDFDPGPGVFNLVSGSNPNAFAAKYTPAGALVWARRVDGPGYTGGWGIAVDAGGSVYVAGHFNGTADFDPGPGVAALTSAGLDDAFVLKLTPTGDYVWAGRIGGAKEDVAFALCVSAGSVFVTGHFTGTVDFDPGPGVFGLTASASGSHVMFVLRLTAGGLFQGARGFGGSPQSSLGRTIAAEPGGGVWLGGYFNGSLVMDGFTFPNTGTLQTGFIAKLNGLGAVVFAASFGPEANVTGVAVDAAGDFIAVGSFKGAVDFNPGPGTFVYNAAAGNFDGFVLKLNPAGGFVWARRFTSPPPGRSFPHDVAVDRSGNIYTAGLFLGTTDFNPGTAVFNISSASLSHDVFISQLNPSGAHVWAGRQGGPTYEDGRAVSTHNGCPGTPTRLHVTGGFSSTGDFDPTLGTANLTSAGNIDMFTAQLSFPNFAAAQHLYVSTDLRVLRYGAWGPPLQTPSVFAPVSGGEPFRPVGLTFGPDCNLYVSNAATDKVMRYRGSNGMPLPSAGNTGAGFVSSQSGGLGKPYGVKFGADARLYAASSEGAAVGALRYDGVTGASNANFTGANPPPSVMGVTFGGPAGDLYVTSGHDVLRYDRQSGALVASWNLATDPVGKIHHDLTFGPGGDLYVTSFETNKVLRFDGVTGAPLADFVPAGSGGLSRPTGLAFGPDGRLYVSSAGTNQILRYDGTTGAFVDVFAAGGGLVLPSYLVFGP